MRCDVLCCVWASAAQFIAATPFSTTGVAGCWTPSCTYSLSHCRPRHHPASATTAHYTLALLRHVHVTTLLASYNKTSHHLVSARHRLSISHTLAPSPPLIHLRIVDSSHCQDSSSSTWRSIGVYPPGNLGLRVGTFDSYVYVCSSGKYVLSLRALPPTVNNFLKPCCGFQNGNVCRVSATNDGDHNRLHLVPFTRHVESRRKLPSRFFIIRGAIILKLKHDRHISSAVAHAPIRKQPRIRAEDRQPWPFTGDTCFQLFRSSASSYAVLLF